jgi:hypothetical protein
VKDAEGGTPVGIQISSLNEAKAVGLLDHDAPIEQVFFNMTAENSHEKLAVKQCGQLSRRLVDAAPSGWPSPLFLAFKGKMASAAPPPHQDGRLDVGRVQIPEDPGLGPNLRREVRREKQQVKSARSKDARKATDEFGSSNDEFKADVTVDENAESMPVRELWRRDYADLEDFPDPPTDDLVEVRLGGGDASEDEYEEESEEVPPTKGRSRRRAPPMKATKEKNAKAPPLKKTLSKATKEKKSSTKKMEETKEKKSATKKMEVPSKKASPKKEAAPSKGAKATFQRTSLNTKQNPGKASTNKVISKKESLPSVTRAQSNTK